MSWWIMPTTADVGIRAFALTKESAIQEVTLGMQSILLSEKGEQELQGLARHTGEWGVEMANSLDNTMVAWLEEVLYQGEVEGRWLVDSQIQLTEESLNSQVSFVNADKVEREVEIKAVTRHELILFEVPSGIEFPGVEPDIPTFEGPGWVAQVIFDI
jgi:SHS2 domain-containing protein